MGRIKRRGSAVNVLAISTVLSCIPIGTGALGIEIAASQSTTATVTNVRVGKHSDKTRVVLDISQPTDFRYHIAADGTAVFVDLPGVEWTASPFEPRHSKGQVVEFRYSPKANGGRFNILTDGPVSINKPFFVKPGGKFGHRIVIDLVPSRMRNQASTKSISPPKGIHNTSFSVSRHTNESSNMVAGLLNIGATDQEPPEIEEIISSRPYPKAINSTGLVTAMHEDPKVDVAQVPTPNPIPNHHMMHGQHGGILGYQNVYLKGAAGISMLPEANNSGQGNENTMEFEPGYNVTGGLGIDLENDFRIEAEMAYTSNALNQLNGTANGFSFASTTFTDGSVFTLAFMGNVAYDFQSMGPFTPFVSGGAGLAGVFINEVTADGTGIADSTDWVFATQLGAGVSLTTTDVTTLEVSYQYFETQDPELADLRGTPFTTQISSHKIMLGARLKF